MSRRKYDIILWGASGFTGRLVAEYLYKKYGADKDLKWAMAGRNQTKLEGVRAKIADEKVPIITADSQDRESLDAMVQQSRVICTTVGPYAKYGSKLVAACVDNQTHYCDITGEVQWMRKMIDQHHDKAERAEVKIVHNCGFDSIPSDMGVFFIQKEAKKRTGHNCKEINMRVRTIKGGISGGTYASLSNVMEEAAIDKSIYAVLTNPYGLNPKGMQSGPDKPDLQKVVYDKRAGSWISPFVMAGINTKVVRRSNAIAGFPYGKDFLYDEATLNGSGIKGRLGALGALISTGILMAAKPGSFLKKGIDRALPKPGEGPSKEKRESGFFKLVFYTTFQDGSHAKGIVTGDRDPGYGSTCKMLAESAVCLAKDNLSSKGGFLTPSVAMGDHLLKRLQENAGLSFTYSEEGK